MLNYIWLGMIAIGVLLAGFLGNLGGPDGIVESAFRAAKDSVLELALPLAGMMMLWLGMMRIAEKAGLIRILARVIRPVLTRLFPDVPAEHPAMGSIVMNMAANILGLANAATPLGLKAMKELESLNPHKGVATNAMCTFLAINTSSVTLIPTTAIAYSVAAGIPNPHMIIGTAIIATTCSTIVAILSVKFFQRLPVFKARPAAEAAENPTDRNEDSEAAPFRRLTPKALVFMGIVVACAAVILFFEFQPWKREAIRDKIGYTQLVKEQKAAKERVAELKTQKNAVEASVTEITEETAPWRRGIGAISVTAIPFVFLIFTCFAMARGIRVYEEFVEGAKEGFQVAVRIMPFLVAILVAMAIFRASGAFLIVKQAIGPALAAMGFPPDLLPLALMRPLSGSGSSGLMAEILSNPGLPDTIKYTAATMFGSTETTFYVLAVYFGSVAVRKSRHALAAGLLADATGVITAVIVCRAFFG
jgi:spore maturation protein SpmA